MDNYSVICQYHNEIFVVDDYAHHPTEVEATLQSARSGWDRRIVAVFQPHLFTRTKQFYREFADALQNADVVIVTDIYPAREQKIAGVTSKLIYDELSSECSYLVPELDDIIDKLDEVTQSGDMVITMGAGNIWRYCEFYVNHLKTINDGVKVD